MIENCIWTTGDEINFFRNAIPKEFSRLEFLKNYKEALCKRTEWGYIDRKKLLIAVETEIEKEIKEIKGV